MESEIRKTPLMKEEYGWELILDQSSCAPRKLKRPAVSAAEAETENCAPAAPAETPVLRLTAQGCTNIGSRHENQDTYRLDMVSPYTFVAANHARSQRAKLNKPRTYAVFDGMGGMDHGAFFATMAAIALDESLQEASDPEQALRAADDKLQQVMHTLDETSGGCTGTVVTLYPDGSYKLAAAGDSPAYLLREGVLQRLFTPQNMAEQLAEQGKTPQVGDDHILTEFIGCPRCDAFKPALAQGRLQAGDVLLLCTDGVIHPFEEGELAVILAKKSTTAETLVKQAAASLRSDNCTAILVRIGKS